MHQRSVNAEAEVVRAVAVNSNADALIAHLKLEIEKLRRELYGSRSERKARLLDQMELQLEDLEAAATEDELAAERAAAATPTVQAFTRQRPSRKPFPDHLPRERVIVPTPESCPCCGSDRLSKLGEDITETLEIIPRQWKVIRTVQERFSCRTCETITQPPSAIPCDATRLRRPEPARDRAARQVRPAPALEPPERALRPRGHRLHPGRCAAATALRPLHELIAAHVLAGERLHGDDTIAPILAKGKTVKGHAWVYVRDDRPFGGNAPAALFHASRDRRGEHPQRHLAARSGILQADAYGGYNHLYDRGRSPGPIISGLCWSHARRKFFELADIVANKRRGKNAALISPIALEGVKRTDPLFEIEREINGLSAQARLAVRRERSRPIIDALEAWIRTERARLSKSAYVAQAIDYMLPRWPAFSTFLDDGKICLTNNAAERALRGLALGRKSWLFAGSDRGADRAAFMYTMIVTAKLNDIDPLAWLADVLARITNMPQYRLPALLPWNWLPLK